MKHLTTENKVHLEKLLVTETIEKVEIELQKLHQQGYDPKELEPYYTRCYEQRLLENMGYISFENIR